MSRSFVFGSLSILFAFALFTAGCGGSDSANIELRVVSDLVPELEVGTATAVLYEGVATANAAGLGSIERNVVSGEPLARGLWLATFERVPYGTYTVWTTLRRQNGEVLGRQPITFVVSGDASYTVTITADCVGVECPGGGNAGFLACIAGVCVDPRCSQTTPEFCPSEEDLFCDAEDNDCVPQMPCGVAVCESGACLQVPSASECGDGEFCSALSGCTAEERPPEAPEDPAGPCGDACALLEQPCTYAFVVCENETGCTAFANREAGSPCPNDGLCNADGECVEGARGDAGVADAGVSDMDVAGDGGVAFDMSVTNDADVAFDMTTAFDASALDAWFDMSVAADTGVAVDMTTPIDTSVPLDMAADMGSTPCAAGYRGTVETGCVEINECAEDLDTCDALTTCTNTAGSYTCSACPSGYVGAGRTGCTEINECLYNACDRRTTCTNTAGGFTCSACPSGFSGTGKTGCDDIDECDMDACDALTECRNTVGSFTCTACPEGYTGDGKTGCDDIDECALGTDSCSDVDDEFCMNGPGGYGCVERRATVAAGSGHTCALTNDGKISCWGWNSSGNLGDGTTTNRVTPEPVNVSGVTFVSVSAGIYHTCALTSAGAVWCWGSNSSGQVGNGSTTDALSPVAISLGGQAASIDAGEFHSCAVLTNGTVKCWGQNYAGQIGDGSTTQRESPAATQALGGRAVALALGGEHTCALLETGTVSCWGSNGVGRLGDGTTTQRNVPTPTRALGGVAFDVASAQTSSCALLVGGKTMCWGNNSGRQFGRSDVFNTSTPVEAGFNTSTTVGLEAGGSYFCAIASNGTADCAGQNDSGQLGDGSTITPTRPTRVALSGIASLSAGTVHTCARLTSSGVKCWGGNNGFQLGYPWLSPIVPYATPTVPAMDAAEVSAGGGFTCARLADGRVRCWGDNSQGQLGNGSTATSRSPMLTQPLGRSAVAIGAGNVHACAVLDDGSVKCWGANWLGHLGNGTTDYSTHPVPSSVDRSGRPGSILSVVAGDTHTCGLLDSGDVECWGGNNYGQLGDGTTTNRFRPISVALGDDEASMVVSGSYHACALLDDASVACWGMNTSGQLGDGTTTNRSAPVRVNLGGAAVSAVAAASNHTCALLATGTIKCWGDGVLGDGTSNQSVAPRTALTSGPAVAIAADSQFTCALLATGSIECWGVNLSGQLGDGTTTRRTTPTTAGATSGPVANFSAGGGHVCTTLESGRVECWGDNTRGQLGIGSIGGNLLAPADESIDL